MSWEADSEEEGSNAISRIDSVLGFFQIFPLSSMPAVTLPTRPPSSLARAIATAS